MRPPDRRPGIAARGVLSPSQEVGVADLLGPMEVGANRGFDRLAELLADLSHPT